MPLQALARTFGPGSLARRYLVLLGLMTLALLSAASTLEMLFGYREARQHIEQLQQLQARAAAREIEQYLQVLEEGLKDAAKFPWGEPGWGADERLQEWHRAMVLMPAVTEFQLVDRDGRERLSVSRTGVDRMSSGQLLLEPATVQGVLPGALRYGRTFYADSGDPQVQLVVADPRPGGAVTVATINLRFLADVVSGLRVGQAGNVYLVDGENRLIAHPRPSEVLRRRDLSDAPPLRLARAAASAPLLLNAVDSTDLTGETVITTSLPLTRADWLLFVEQPRREALLPALATLQRSLLLLGLGALLAVAASMVFARRMAAPIVALRRATARIAAGNLDAPLELNRHDEIEDLAQDFNQMASRLRDLYASLEAKVAERTAQLSEARDVLSARAEQLTQLKDEAERANAAKTRFLAAASHDLRQPMHSISLLLGVLQGRLTSPEHLALADKIQSSVATMENLFGNLLDISKLDAGTVQAHIEDVNLAWLLHGLEQIWAPQAAEKGLKLRVRPCDVVVKGDAALLARIAGNLAANAIRYTREGGVLVACRRRGAMVELEVWDSGPGIEPRYQEAIFEEFFRIEAPGTGQEKGLGLGLSIVQRSAHILGYRLSVHSRVGKGSVFRVEMPLAGPATRSAKVSPRLAASQQALEGRFIVVVDDEETNAQALVDALLALRCHVVAAASCEDMLAQLQQHLRVPDLIVTDYQLGAGRDGFEVIARLRQHYDEDIGAVIVTANTEAALQPQAQACGARLLHKPIGLQRLLEAMRESLASMAEP
ncbi:hybrid sensor histidine kinase/response regulator [Roseateles sp. P5_E1]